jgi:hypothetical protein
MASPALVDKPPAELLIFNAEYKIVICTPCYYALVPEEIAAYLRSYYQKDKGRQ